MITTSEVAVSVTIDNDVFLKEIIKELEPFGTVELENNQTIIPTSEEEITTPAQGEKVISRNVSTRRRNFR